LLRSRNAVEVRSLAPERAAQVALVKQASHSSLILHLGDEDVPLDPHVASMLLEVSSGVRLIALASSVDIARRALTGARIERMQHIEVRPLAYRAGEISKLLDHRFAEADLPRRTADLTPANQEALRAYDWPGNFAELREIADAIVAHDTRGGLRPAAASLGMSSHKKLVRRFDRVGLGLPLFGSDD
jgi:hypothetical protein